MKQALFYQVQQVRELLERNLPISEISHRLHMDPATVAWAIDFINGLVT